jgi:hypothetical protein
MASKVPGKMFVPLVTNYILTKLSRDHSKHPTMCKFQHHEVKPAQIIQYFQNVIVYYFIIFT